jgi:hypothetical protein
VIGTDGTTELAYNDDNGAGLDSLIDWVAPASGTYYIEVSGFGSASGSYDLLTSILSPGAFAPQGLAAVPPRGAESTAEMSQVVAAAAAADDASTPSSGIGGAFLLPAAVDADADSNLVSRVSAGAIANNDLALMAWLTASGNGDRQEADVAVFDQEFAVSSLVDDSQTLDEVFETLEGNALAAAAI